MSDDWRGAKVSDNRTIMDPEVDHSPEIPGKMSTSDPVKSDPVNVRSCQRHLEKVENLKLLEQSDSSSLHNFRFFSHYVRFVLKGCRRGQSWVRTRTLESVGWVAYNS